MGEISWAQALAWRMRRHHLVERAPARDFLTVVSAICGLHAQLMSSAELSLWARVDGFERETVSEALWEKRSLVKFWAMRGTLHLMPTAELEMWLAALATTTKHGNVGHEGIERLCAAVGGALDGRVMTREELAQAVEEATGDAELAEFVRFSWGSYLKAASFRGLLCFAPSVGGSVRFTTAANWVGEKIDKPDGSEALKEMTRRFLTAYGPTTAADLALWRDGLGPRPGRLMLAALGDEAVEVDLEGERGWVLARDLPEISATKLVEIARLLPAFDPWVIGASRTSASVLEPTHKPRVFRPQGWISPVLLVNGKMVGVWKHERKGQRLMVTLDPFGRLPAWARKQLESEAERLAGFLGGDLELTIA